MATENTRTNFSLEGVERVTTRAYTLEVIEGPNVGKRIEAGARVVRIGTNPDCTLELDDTTVSRFHARIEADKLGHRLIDEASKNGTFVNDLRIGEVYLSAGAQIRLGSSTLSYRPSNDEVEFSLSKANQFGGMLGSSAAMREIFAILERVSSTDMTVLIEGESGTGKELVADAIHQHSQRSDKPFVVFDCSAVAPNLIESELFGHVKGAFTGATDKRTGAFQRASGGTLFLDEMGELPVELQAKLLRVLEQRVVRPVGGDTEMAVDVRIVAATNRNLAKEVELGHFRQDLFYRIAVIRLVLPPLRRRTEDIPMLVEHFLKDLSPGGQPLVQVGYETIRKLQEHPWPGNVRELRNFVERAALLTTSDRLETKHLVAPTFGLKSDSTEPAQEDAIAQLLNELDNDLAFKDAKARLIEVFERTYWERLLEKTAGNVSAAARIAGIHRKSAEYLLKKLDIQRPG